MIRKILLGAIFTGVLAVSAPAADVVVRIGPPRAIVERRSHAPGRDYVWINGYHRWDGRGYVWEPGRWERPPHRRSHWVQHRWVKRGNGWVLVEGHWR